MEQIPVTQELEELESLLWKVHLAVHRLLGVRIEKRDGAAKRILDYLLEHGRPVKGGELSTALGLSPVAVRKAISRQKGLIRVAVKEGKECKYELDL